MNTPQPSPGEAPTSEATSPAPSSHPRAAVQQFEAALDLKARVEQHPLGMVLAAFGAGYVLGGGLFTPTTGRVVRLAMKLAALPVVQSQLLDLAEAAVDGLARGPVPPVAAPAQSS